MYCRSFKKNIQKSFLFYKSFYTNWVHCLPHSMVVTFLSLISVIQVLFFYGSRFWYVHQYLHKKVILGFVKYTQITMSNSLVKLDEGLFYSWPFFGFLFYLQFWKNYKQLSHTATTKYIYIIMNSQVLFSWRICLHVCMNVNLFCWYTICE